MTKLAAFFIGEIRCKKIYKQKNSIRRDLKLHLSLAFAEVAFTTDHEQP